MKNKFYLIILSFFALSLALGGLRGEGSAPPPGDKPAILKAEATALKTGESSAQAALPRYTLADCLKTGLAQSPVLKQQAAKVKQSDAKIGEVWGGQDFQVNIASYGMANTPKISYAFAPGQSALIIPASSYQAGITISRLISNFGFLDSQADLATLQRDADKVNLFINQRDLKTNLAGAYLQVMRTQSLESLSRDTLSRWKAHLDQTKSLRKNGVVAGYDILRSQVEVSKAKEQLVSAQKNSQLALSTLSNLMGYEKPQPLAVAGDDLEAALKPQTLKAEKLEDASLQAMKQRLELAVMDLLIGQAQSSLDLVKNSTNPTLSLSSTYNWKTATFMTKGWEWQTMLNFNLPVFTGREKPSQLKAAKAALEQAQYGRDDFKLKIALEVEAAYLSYQETLQQLATARTQLAQAKEALRVAELRYKEGLSDGVERIDAQNQYNAALVNRKNADYDYLNAVLILKRAMGQIEAGEVL